MSKLWNRTLRPNNIYPKLIRDISTPDATRLLTWMGRYEEENPGGVVTVCLNEDAVDWNEWFYTYDPNVADVEERKAFVLSRKGQAKVDDINDSFRYVNIEWDTNGMLRRVPKIWIKEVR